MVIHMSNNDSIDEETKRILAEVDADAQSSTNDSKESGTKKNETNDDESKKVIPMDYDIENVDEKIFDEVIDMDNEND